MPTVNAKSEQIQTGTMMPKGSVDPTAARMVITVVGIKVMEAVLITTNIHISSDAMSFFGLIL